MRNFNFLSKSSSQSGSHRVVTLASTVGSPSAHRRGTMLKLISVLVLILTIGVGQMWGTDLSFTFEDNSAHRTNGNNSYTAGPQSYTQHNCSISCSYMDAVTSGSPLTGIANAMGRIAKNTTNSPVLKIGPIDLSNTTITGISYNVKGVGAMAQKCAYSTNGTSWTDVVSINGGSMPTSKTSKSSSTLSVSGTSTFYVRITTSVTSSTTSNRDVQIDDVTITYTPNPSLTCATTSLSFSATSGSTDSKNFTFSGANLTANAAISFSGTNASLFSASPNNVSKGTGTITNQSVTVTYSPTDAGNHSATLTITSGSATKSIILTGEAAAAPSCSNEITITKGTPSNGSFSMAPNGGNVCIDEGNASVTISNINPSSGYRFKEITSSGGGTIDNNAKTVSNISANTTINVVFEQIPPFTVSFVTGTGNTAQADIAEGSSQAGITLPAGPGTIKCAADGWTFAGWSVTNVASETTTAPTILDAGAKYYPTEDCTLYAVYRRSETGTPTEQSIKTIGFESTESFTATSTYNSSNTTTGGSSPAWSINYGAFTSASGAAQSGTQAAQFRIYGTGGGFGELKTTGSFANVTKFTFYAKTANATDTKLTTYYSTNGSTWTALTSDRTLTTSHSKYTENINASGVNTVYIKFSPTGSTRPSSGNYAISIDNIEVFGMVSSTTTYYLSSPDCCTELGSLNGSVDLTQNSAVLTWDNLEGVAASNPYAVTYRKGSEDYGSANVGEITTNAQGKKTCTITDLECGTEYDFKIAVTGDGSHCDAEQVLEDKSTTKWNITYNLTNTVALSEGPAQGANACGDITASFTKDGLYTFPEEITVTIGGNAATVDVDYLWDDNKGELYIEAAKVTGDVVIMIAGVAPLNPIVTPSPDILSFEQVKKGAAIPAAQDIAMTGHNLTAALTVTSSNPSLYAVSVKSGSLTPDGNKDASPVITVTPQAGITNVAGDKNATITISGGGLAEAVVVNVTFNVQETYTVNWYVNGTKIDANSKTDVEGTAVSAPSDFSAFTDCQDLTFVGWKEGSAIDGGSTTEAPSLAEVVTTIPAANKDYYAVFAEGTPGSAQWEKATSIAAGEYLIVYETGGVAFDGSLSTLDAVGNTIAVTINESKIAYSNATEAAKFTIAAKTGGYSIKSASNLYIGQTSNANGLATSATDDYTNAISISAGNADIVCSSAYLRYNNASNQTRFRYYKSASYSDQKAIQLYKKNVSPANFTKWYTTCPQCSKVTLQKVIAGEGAEAAGNAIAFSPASTTVKTCEAAEVTVSPTIATGWELTSVVPTGVPGVTYDAGVISIPQGKEGTLNVTATFGLKDYTVTLNHTEGVEPTMTGDTEEAHYGATINLTTTVPSNAKFVNWTSSDVTITNPTSATEASFTMPAKAVTVTANFIVVHNVAWAIENTPSTSTLAGVYVKGIVKANPSVSTQYHNADYFICDLDANGEPANEFYVYRGKNVDNTNFTNVNQLTEGDEVVILGTLKTYQGTKEFDAGNYIIANGRTAADVSSVVVSGTADKTEYFASETFQSAGLSARAIYNTGYQKDVTAEATWKANGVDSYAVSESGSVNVTAAYGGKTSADYPVAVTVTTKTLESIELSETALTGYKGVALPKPTTVTAHFDDQGTPSTSNVTALAVYDEAGNYDATSTSEQTIQVKYSFGLNTRTANYTVTLSSIANTLNTAYSVNKARDVIDLDQETGNNLDLANADNKVYVVGRVTSVENNQIIIKDDADETKVLYLWKYDYGTEITSVEVGDLIKAYGNLKLYSPKYEMDEGCEIVWKQPKVELSFANKTMEVGENWTISGTVTPAEAPVTFSIKAGSDECIALNDDEITATAVGTATIVVTAEDYNEYLGNSKEFTVTVSPAKVHTDVIILAEYNGNYYALNNTAETTEVQFENGMVIVPDQATKMAILWDRAEREGVATFYNATANKFLKGGTNPTLGVATEEGIYTSWTWVETETKAYYTSNSGASARTFMYMNGQAIKNYAVSNIGNGSYAQANVYAGAVAVKISSNTDVSDLPENASVLVEEGVTLTIDAASTLDNLIVEAGGKVTGASDLTVVNDLLIKTSLGNIAGDDSNINGVSGEIANSNISATGDVFIEIELTQEAEASEGWYAFSVPFPVDAMNGVYYGDTKLTNEVGYAIMSYHGDVRAQGLYGWKKYRGIMQPGVLYIITVGDTDYKTLRFKKVAGENIVASNVVSVNEYASETGNDQDGGWNGIGNPNLQVSNYSATTIMQFLDHSNNCFRPRISSEINLLVGSAFMMQIQTTTTITISVGNSGSIALAPARERSVEENTLYELKLRNTETNAVEDNLFFSASEDATNTYEIGRDVAKFSMGAAKCAQMYVPAYGTQLCAADFPLVNGQAEYPLAITAPAAGSYRIETPTVYEDATLYLTYEGNIIWDLTVSPYEAEFDKGQNNDYGLMLVRKAPQVTTGVETIDNSQSTIHNCQKVILNDHVYILRDAQLYDVTGKAVK